MEFLYLNKPDSIIPITIAPEIVEQLKSHQIDGLRFLYRNFANNLGAIINDSEGLGKRATVASLMHAVLQNNSNIISSALILCSDKNQADNWNYILQTFTGLNTQNFNDSENSNIVIEQIGAMIINLQIIISKGFDIVILEWPGLQKWHDINFFLSKIKTRKRIIISDINLLEKLEDLWECTDWIQPSFLGNLVNFTQKYRKQNRKTHVILSSLLRDILLQRNINEINIKDLQIINDKVHKKNFENWKENQNLKLALSDSQTSSDSQSTINMESIPKMDLTEKVQSKTKEFTIFELSLTSDSSLASELSSSINLYQTEKIFQNNNGKIIESKKDQENRNAIEKISKQKRSIDNKESLETVSARAVSPSNYTSDETFDALNFLFPSNENNARKRRSPKRKRITDTRWLKCTKTTNTSGNNIDLMYSSDESILNLEIQNEPVNNTETTQDIINRTLLKIPDKNAKNQKSANQKYQKGVNETENILDSIFFS